MKDLIDDLVAEQNALDRAVRDAPQSCWDAPSPAEGLLMRDCIAHLMDVDNVTARIAETGEPADFGSGPPARPPLASGQVQARELRIAELLAGWRAARARLAAAVPWMLAHQRRHLLQAEKVKEAISL